MLVTSKHREVGAVTRTVADVCRHLTMHIRATQRAALLWPNTTVEELGDPVADAMNEFVIGITR